MKLKFRSSIIVLALVAVAVVATSFFTASTRADQPKVLTAEQIVETVIAVSGGRVGLSQIRRNGLERGRMSRMTEDGRPEEARYELRFVHADKIEKDKVRIDCKTPQAEYSLINSEGRVFGIINGSPFTPRADATADFISQQTHSIDALLRYKENESKISSAERPSAVPKRKRRETRKSTAKKPGPRPVLRPTLKGRSVSLVSPFVSTPAIRFCSTAEPR